MSNPYYKAMASQFLDLWQNHISTMMADKDFMNSLLEVMQANGQGLGNTQHYAKQATEYWRSALSSGHDGDALAKLERRLAALEKQLAALEDAALPPARPRRVRERGNGKHAKPRDDKKHRGRGKSTGKRPAKRR